RQRGVPRPLHVAWGLVGTPDPKEFPSKLQPGQPLGDLTPSAVLDKCKWLVLDRLKNFRVAGDKDCRAAAQLGLLNALAGYDPSIDVSVGLYAKIYRLIDDEIKRAIRGKRVMLGITSRFPAMRNYSTTRAKARASDGRSYPRRHCPTGPLR